MMPFDCVYGETPHGPLTATVYRPEGTGPFPALVDVHGGGWGQGDRSANAHLCTALAEAGILVAALDFRLAQTAVFPASVADVNLGIRWLKSRAREFGSRPDLVGGIGTSSGGHQLMLNALRPADPLYAALPGYPEQDAHLAFAILCWPVADPWARLAMARERGNAQLIRSHDAYWAREEDMLIGNPQRIVERADHAALPPLLLIQGTADENLPEDMARRFAATYRAAGGTVELLEYAGQRHAFITRDPDSDAAAAAIEAMCRFVHEQTGDATKSD